MPLYTIFLCSAALGADRQQCCIKLRKASIALRHQSCVASYVLFSRQHRFRGCRSINALDSDLTESLLDAEKVSLLDTICPYSAALVAEFPQFCIESRGLRIAPRHQKCVTSCILFSRQHRSGSCRSINELERDFAVSQLNGLANK